MSIRKMTREEFFLLGLSVYYIVQILSESQVSESFVGATFLQIVRYGFLIILFLALLFSKYKGRYKLFMTVFATLFFALINMIIFNGGNSLVLILLIVYLSKNVSLERIFSVSIKTLVIGHVFILMLAVVGILDDTVTTRYIAESVGGALSGEYMRHSMGFLVHNQIPLAFFLIVILYMAYKKEQINLLQLIVINSLNYIIFVYFGSRIVFLLIIMTSLAYMLLKIFMRINKQIGKTIVLYFCPAIFVVLCILNVLIAVIYNDDNKWMKKLDLIMNHRVSMAHEALEYYGLNLFGNGVVAGTYNNTAITNTVDSGYITLFIQRGIIIGVIVLSLWTYITYIAAKKQNYYLVLALVFFSVENVINAHMISYKIIPFLCIIMNQEDKFLNIDYHLKRKKRMYL